MTMTIEEKAKRFDEALAMAKECITYIPDDAVNKYMLNIFPELKELGDEEEVRKAMIDFFKHEREEGVTVLHYGVNIERMIAWLEKQGEKKSIWHNEDEEAKIGSLILLIMQSGTPIVAKIIEPKHTFNHGERWAYIDDLLEKQSEQKPVSKLKPKFRIGDVIEVKPMKCQDKIFTGKNNKIIDITEESYILDDGKAYSIELQNGWKLSEQKSDKVEPKFKVKYAGCEYDVLEVKDTAGVTYYGIEDEPNHIDYVKADNCEIISGGYGIKENGSPYPTKPAVFSEQQPTNKVEPKFHEGEWVVIKQ